MTGVVSFRDLETWQVGMDVVEAVYRATQAFPREEQYGLTSQLRRAAVSIPSNVAEGHARKATGAYANHVSIALGSHAELTTCLEIGFRLGYLSKDGRAALVGRMEVLGRLLGGLYRSLDTKLARERR